MCHWFKSSIVHQIPRENIEESGSDSCPTRAQLAQAGRAALASLVLLLSACASVPRATLEDVEARTFPAVESAVESAFDYAFSVTTRRELGFHVWPQGDAYRVSFERYAGRLRIGGEFHLDMKVSDWPSDTVAWGHTHPLGTFERGFAECSDADEAIAAQLGIPGFVKAPGHAIDECEAPS